MTRVPHLFSLVAAVLDTFVIASFLLFERSQARTNNRPMRRRVVIPTCIALVVGIVLIVLSFVPLN